MVVLSSNVSNGQSNTLEESKALATDTLYLFPHILQCANAIHKFTANEPIKLLELSKYTVMKTLENAVLPVVNHLGGSFIFKQRSSSSNRSRYLSLINIHNFLNFPFILSEVDAGLSIPVKTALTTNNEFINYFYSNQQNSEVIVIEASYKDKVSKQKVDIIFNTSNSANILDWSFKGDPNAPLELTVQTKTTNNDGSVGLSDPIKFTFYSSETTDVIFTKTFPRTTMQIPAMAFSRAIGLGIITSFFLIEANLHFLGCASATLCCLPGFYGASSLSCTACPSNKPTSPFSAPNSSCQCPNATASKCFACTNKCKPYDSQSRQCLPVSCPSGMTCKTVNNVATCVQG